MKARRSLLKARRAEVLDRRAFLWLAGSSSVLTDRFTVPLFAQDAGTQSSPEESNAAARLAELGDNYTVADSVRQSMASDFGVYIHKLPAGVLRPRSPQDIQATARYCAA